MQGKRIVIAVDGTPASQAAVETGIALAGPLSSPVVFVHGASPLEKHLYRDIADSFEGPTVAETLAHDPVLAAAAERASQAGVEFEVELIGEDHALTPEAKSAEIAAAIAGLAGGLDAALIVVGSRGRGPVAGAVLGSVSHNLINYATVPVVVVHAAASQER